jgi:hypothetical protein
MARTRRTAEQEMLIIVFFITALAAAGIVGLITLVWAGIAREEADMSLRPAQVAAHHPDRRITSQRYT